MQEITSAVMEIHVLKHRHVFNVNITSFWHFQATKTLTQRKKPEFSTQKLSTIRKLSIENLMKENYFLVREK